MIPEFVGANRDDQARAKTYLNDLKSGKYKDVDEMGAHHFNSCLIRKAAPRFDFKHTSKCFWEQRVMMSLQVSRFDERLSMETASSALIKDNEPVDEATIAHIRRLAKDVYTILKPNEANAFYDAQFQLCMTYYK